MDPKNVKTVAVIGLGKMGGDWVANLLEGGLQVVGYDNSEKTLETFEERLKKALKWIGKKRKQGDEKFVEEAYSKVTIVKDEQEFIEKAKEAQIFLEVIFEDLKLKCDMLSRIVPKLAPDVVIWSNTSSLSVAKMGIASGKPERLVGTHGMNPVYQMPAVEVVSHEALSQEVLQFTLDVLTNLGKIPFVASDVPGFWVNKHLVPFMLEAMRALERGEITVGDGDKGLKNSLGHPQGVFKLSDFIGMDTMYRVSMAMYLATQDPRYYPPAIMARMFKNNELGVKTGKGFYEWDGFKIKAERDFTDYQIKDTGTVLEV